jgi:hypothetical protein
VVLVVNGKWLVVDVNCREEAQKTQKLATVSYRDVVGLSGLLCAFCAFLRLFLLKYGTNLVPIEPLDLGRGHLLKGFFRLGRGVRPAEASIEAGANCSG